MRGAVIRALRSIQVPWFVSAVVVFCLIYAVAFSIWSKILGGGAWPPAWPVARTRFVLAMITAPIWAACMVSCGVVLRFTGSRSSSRSYQGYELAPIPHMDEQLPTSGKMCPRPRISWCTVRLSLYLLIIAFGIFLLCFCEQPNDIRFRSLLKEAMRSPRPKGFGNNGMSRSLFRSDLTSTPQRKSSLLPFFTTMHGLFPIGQNKLPGYFIILERYECLSDIIYDTHR